MSNVDSRRIWRVDNPSGRIPATDAEKYEHQLRWRDFPWPEVAKPPGRGDQLRHTVIVNGEPIVPRLWYEPTRDGGIVRPEPAATNKLRDSDLKSMEERFGQPEAHRALEQAGVDLGTATDLMREAASFEESGHAIAGDTMGLRAVDIFITRTGAGQYNHADCNKALAVGDFGQTLQRHLALSLAGQIGQRVKYSQILNLSTPDEEHIAKLLKFYHTERERAEARAKGRSVHRSNAARAVE